MKTGFYRRLALTNMKNHAKLYVPNALMGIGLTAVIALMSTLSLDERLKHVRGGEYLPTLLPMGTAVVMILAFIMVLYTNSFLMKRRSKEFGLYNVLGLEKRHISRILMVETLILMGIVIAGGLAASILLYRLCTLIICRMLGVDSVLGLLHIDPLCLIGTAGFFISLYLLTYLANRFRIARMNPVEMIQTSRAGEREPRISWALLVIGMACLAGGYFISLTTKSPLQAMNLFFGAVILVVIGTYCLFLTGSIALLKVLKNNKKFYYTGTHMPAISGLIYRMKQNAVGLASISILATMVLVMVSTTVSLYAGIGDTLDRSFPHFMYMGVEFSVGNEAHENEVIEIPEEAIREILDRSTEKYGLEVSFLEYENYLNVSFLNADGTLLMKDSFAEGDMDAASLSKLSQIWFMTAEDYNRITGASLSLAEGQIAVYSEPENIQTLPEEITIGEMKFRQNRPLSDFPSSMSAYRLADCFGIVVPDQKTMDEIYRLQKKGYGENASEPTLRYQIDFTDNSKAAACWPDLLEDIHQSLMSYMDARLQSMGETLNGYGYSMDSRSDFEAEIYGVLGTLLFLGLMLSIIFLLTTALIIYYKQISEGYEDRERFQIMQKVGMSREEVKAAIRSQILIVFFLPLMVAAIHTAFAFPMLCRLLKILFMSDISLFIGCTAGALAVFALIYTLIYLMTAKIYVQIVS